jgi:ABC-type multidrug transport system fused ATPase/permease subunit
MLMLWVHYEIYSSSVLVQYRKQGCRANYNVRVKLHRSLLLQEAAFFDSTETGYLLSRLNSDVNKIGQVISYHVNVVLRQFAQFVFGSMYLVRISPKLSMWAFAGILLVAWLSAVYGDFARDLAEKVQDTFAEGTAVAETSFSMSETVRAFDGTETESEKYENSQSKALELEEVQAWAYGSHKFLSDSLQTALQVGLLLACWGVGKAGGLPARELTTFMFYTNFVLESSNEVGDQWAKIQQAVGASTSVFDLIKRVPAIRDPPGRSSKNGLSVAENLKEVNGDSTTNLPIISMKNVKVEYEAMERPALSNINLNIYPGDRIALVGRSGSGKSSMLRTLLRFYDPSEGSITLGEKDLRSLTRAETSDKIAVVEQEPHVFPMSLMENVLYGIKKDAIDPETGDSIYSESYRDSVSKSLKLAGLPVEPGSDLGLELETRIGEGGRSLSGGQRQRVAIARALIRSPEVLLLDEPTAALDSESEKKVVASLQRAMEHTKSMVMVTHRLGVVRALDVNRVVVLDGGRIVEDGHPEELLRDEHSLYSALAREQGIQARASNDPVANR